MTDGKDQRNLGGHPSLYDPSAHPRLVFWLAHAGLTLELIADEIGVHVDTVYEWQKVHPEFSEAIKSGKVTPDDEVEAALLRRAKGFKVTEGNKEKVVPPDTLACIFWLKNRRPAQWRDKHDVAQEVDVFLTDARKTEAEDRCSAADLAPAPEGVHSLGGEAPGSEGGAT